MELKGITKERSSGNGFSNGLDRTSKKPSIAMLFYYSMPLSPLINEDARAGPDVGIATTDDPSTWRIDQVCGASLMDAFYAKHKEPGQAQNEQLIATVVEDGFVNLAMSSSSVRPSSILASIYPLHLFCFTLQGRPEHCAP